MQLAENSSKLLLLSKYRLHSFLGGESTVSLEQTMFRLIRFAQKKIFVMKTLPLDVGFHVCSNNEVDIRELCI